MVRTARERKQRIRGNFIRFLIYFVGLWIVSLGIVLCVKCGLGISPISSVPFVLEEILPYSFGTLTMLFHLVNILIQYLLEKRLMNLRVFLQIPVAVLFGRVIDLLKGWMNFETAFLLCQLSCLVLSIFFTALGMVLMLNMQLAHNPPDGTVRLLSSRMGLELGKVKIIYDVAMVLLSALISILFLGRIRGFGIATVVSAVFVGRTVSFLQKKIFEISPQFYNLVTEISKEKD